MSYNEEEASILGALGTVTTFSTIGYGGYYAFKHFSKVKERAASFNKMKQKAETKAVETIKDNLSSHGFDKLVYKPSYRGASLKELSKMEGIDKDFIKELDVLGNRLKGVNHTVGYTKIGDKVASIGIDLGSGYMELTNIAHDGIIFKQGTSTMPAYVPGGFLVSQDTRNIIEGAKAVNTEMLKKKLVSYHTAKLNAINWAVTTKDTGMSATAKIKEINASFRDYYLYDYGTSAFSAQRHRNSFVPTLMTDGKLHKFSSYDKVTQEYVSALEEFFKIQKDMLSDRNIPITFGQTADNLAKGVFTIPYKQNIYYNGIREAIGRHEIGSHQLNQSLSKEVKFSSHAKSNSKTIQSLIDKGTNIKPVLTLHVGDELEPILNALLERGVGNNGVPLPGIGDEGIIAGKKYSQIALEMSSVNTMNLTHEGEITQKGIGLFDHLSTQVAGEDLYALNKGEISRGAILKDMIESGEINKYLKEKPLDINEFFKIKNDQSVTLFKNATGDFKLGGYGHTLITGMSMGESGITFHTKIGFTQADNAAKSWFSVKGIKMRDAHRVEELAEHILAYSNYLNNEESYEKALSMLIKDVRDGKLHKKDIVDKYIKENSYLRKEGILENARITRQNIRDTASVEGGDTDAIRRLTAESTRGEIDHVKKVMRNSKKSGAKGFIAEAERGADIANTKTDQRLRMTWDLISAAPPYPMYGYGANRPVAINDIMADRLRAMGLNPAAQFIESKFKVAEQMQLIDDYLPMFDITKKHHKSVKLEILNDDTIKKLFSTDIEESKAMVSALLGDKNVSSKTKLYIEINKEVFGTEKTRHVPVSLTDSPYTGGVNVYRVENAEKSIRSQLTKDSLRYVMAEKYNKKGNPEEAWRTLNRSVANTVFNSDNFTHVLNRDARSLMAVDGFLLSDDYINSLVKQGKITEEGAIRALAKHGLELGAIDSDSVHGVSGREYSSLKKRMSLRGRHKDIMMDTWEVVGRHPGNASEAFTASRAINMDILAHNLKKEMSETQGNRFINSWKSNKSDMHVYMPSTNIAKTGTDFDNDPITRVPITDEELRRKTAEAVNSEAFKEKRRLLDAIYGKKGNLKGMGSDNVAQTIIELAATEKASIAPVYQKARVYSSPFMDISKRMSDSSYMSKEFKGIALNQFVLSLSEGTIGGKNLQTKEAVDKLLGIFKPSMTAEGMDARVKAFRELVGEGNQNWTFNKEIKLNSATASIPEGSHVFSEAIFSDDDIKGWLKEGDEVAHSLNGILHKVVNKGVKAEEDVKSLLTALRDRGYNGLPSESAMVRAMSAAGDTSSRARKAINSIGDASEEIIPKLLKNKKLGIAAAAALGAGLVLTSPSDDIKGQEVREESRPLKPLPPPAAIDPPTGMVRNDRVPGYKVNIHGKAAKGHTIKAIRNDLSGMGLAPHGTYIDKNDAVDAQYLKKLNDEERANTWSFSK